MWNDQESGRKITFMSIAFNASAISTNDIKEIGLSHWSRQSFQQQVAHHWRIVDKVETKDVVEFGTPDLFDFGTTHHITAADVVTVLDDWAFSLDSGCEELCIVMYGETAIKTLGRHWKSPVPAIVLDLEAVWRQRHHEAVQSTFEEVAPALGDVASLTSNFDHAGNQAYCQIAVLTSMGKEKKRTFLRLEDPFE